MDIIHTSSSSPFFHHAIPYKPHHHEEGGSLIYIVFWFPPVISVVYPAPYPAAHKKCLSCSFIKVKQQSRTTKLDAIWCVRMTPPQETELPWSHIQVRTFSLVSSRQQYCRARVPARVFTPSQGRKEITKDSNHIRNSDDPSGCKLSFFFST
jgi:hypothetical protein